jgi:hypothetical protein
MPVSMSKMLAAALLAAFVAIAAPARGAETATANDTARFLAGLPPASDSALAAMAKDAAWQQHARYLDSIFAREDSVTLSKVRAFSQRYLTDKHDTMLYMFSGPDFLYATSFFPSASTYVLAGLEPVGEVPQLTGLSRGTVDGTLHNLERSMGTLLSYSFFITKNMKTQLHEGPVNGTLPILYVFLARTGKTIHEVTYVGLDKDGNVQTPDEASGKGARRLPPTAAPGIRIVFSDGNGPKQTLYYFGTNIADGSIEQSGFLTFCKKLGVADSFIKSASYLLHTGGFTKVRNLLLERSATILQDDSGIPLAYFDPKQWHFRPFGHYVGPLNIFGAKYQERMVELFARNATPLDFGIGYRWRNNESNLLLAQKVASATSDNELAPSLPAHRYIPSANTQTRKKGRSAGKPPRTRRSGADSDVTGSLGCRITAIFPFCSDTPRPGQPKPGR